MDLPDSGGVVADMPAPLAQGAKGWFNNDAETEGTIVTPDCLNGVFAELLNVIEAADIVPSKTVTTQLLAAIQALIAAGASMPTGFRGATTDTTAPNGWVLASGRTIGNVGSGATERANADTQNLFNAYWARRPDLQLHNAAGAAIARGASALADWSAGCAIALPDYNNRTGVGKDITGTGRITVAGGNVDGTVIGNAGGSQNHVLANGEIPWGDDAGATAANNGGPVQGSSPKGAAAFSIMNPFIIELILIKL